MYLDSAIIVKLLVREEDSSWFNRNLVDRELWSSELALAEVHSAVMIKERTGQISASQRKSALARLNSMHEEKVLRLHPLNFVVIERATGLLLGCHPDVGLRSLDAIHLATALIHARGPLCTTDGKLRTAAQKIGVACFPEEISEITKD